MGTPEHMLPAYHRAILLFIAAWTVQSQVSPGLEELRAHA